MMPLPEPSWLPSLRLAIEIAATAAFALSGVLVAARKRLDAVGVCVAAFLTAFGGGTLRDLLLDHRPFFWMAQVDYVWGIMALSVAAMLFMRARHIAPTERLMRWPDTLGLGLFAAIGTDLAMAQGTPALLAVCLGVTTAVAGGVLRDVVCNDIPQALHDHRPYALCAFAGGWADVGLRQLDAPAWMPLVACLLVTVSLRSIALRWNWQLPAWKL